MSETIPDPNMVAVPRSQFDLMQRSTALLDQMLGGPDAAAAEDLVKKHNPHAVFPNRANREALLAPVNEAIERVRAETRAEVEAAKAEAKAVSDKWAAREAAEAEAAQQRQTAAITDQINAVKSKRGFSDDMMGKVLDRMRTQNSPDVEAAAAWVAESIPKPLPASGHDYLPSQVDVFGSSDPANEAWKQLHDNPSGWQTQELRNIVKDPEFLRLGNQ